jgi:hypothetical protein
MDQPSAKDRRYARARPTFRIGAPCRSLPSLAGVTKARSDPVLRPGQPGCAGIAACVRVILVGLRLIGEPPTRHKERRANR